MGFVQAHLRRSRLPIDSISCATSWMHSINSNASAAPPAASLSVTEFELRQLPQLIRRRYRTRHPSPSPVSGGDRTEPDRISGSARALRAQGWSILAIGREVSLSPKTVRRLLHPATPPSQEYVRHPPLPPLFETFL